MPRRPGSRTGCRSTSSSSSRARLRADREPVDAVAGHRLVGVGDGDDRGLERDLVSGEALRVPGAVGTLVVRQDPVPDVVQLAARENPGSELGMALHLRVLLGGERPRLAEDRVRHPDLADVVEDAGEPQPLDSILVKAELRRHHLAEAADGLAVAGGPRVALVERLRQAEHRGEVGLGLDVPAAGDRPQDVGDLGAVDDGAVTAQRLGRVQRPVPGGQKRGVVEAMLGEARDPDGGGQLELRRRKRLAHPVDQLLGEEEGVMLVGLREDDGELLAPGPRHHIHQPRRVLEQLADPLQCLVARLDALPLVDPLEAVHVDDEQADRPALGLGPFELPLERFVQGDSVRQAGERIGTSRVGEPPEQRSTRERR